MNDQTKSDSVEKIEGFCPDCCRDKAYNVESIQWGYCPKWWAVRDPDAAKDCERIAARIRALPTSATAQEALTTLKEMRAEMREKPDNGQTMVLADYEESISEWASDLDTVIDQLENPGWMKCRACLGKGWDEDGKCSCEEGYVKVAPPPQPVSETAAQGSVEFGKALDELLAASFDQNWEEEKKARANVERLYSLRSTETGR